MPRTIKVLAVLAALIGAALVLAAQSVTRLTENGETVSDRLVLVNGQLMVPVRDIATHFGYRLTVANGVAELHRTPTSGEIGAPEQIQPGTPGVQTGPGAIPPPVTQAPVTPPTATAPVPAPVVPVTPGTIPPNANPSVMPTTVIPGTAVTTATEGLFPSYQSSPPANLTSALGSPITFAGFQYTVTGIQDEGGRYKTVYDQRNQVIHPSWKTDKLVAVQVSVKNVGTVAAYPPAPGSYGVTVFDDQKVGYPAVALDMRQAANPEGDSNQYDITTVFGPSDLVLGPGGSLNYAVLASVPKDRGISQVILSLPPGSTTDTASGANLTVNGR